MKNRSRVPTSLPNGLVIVDKGSDSRKVMVGILNGKHMPAFGFDVRGMAPNHYRIVEHGKFGIVVGARQALEVRILVDGKLMLEKVVTPHADPSPIGMDPALYRRMVESPQAHYLVQDGEGKPFMFSAPDQTLTEDEIIAEQIHPGLMSAPPTMDQLDRDGLVLEELRVDLNPADFGFGPQNLEAPDADADVSVGEHIASASDKLAVENGEGEAITDGATSKTSFEGETGLTRIAPQEEGPALTINREDPTMQAKSWAPSHGLIAVGIRMIQSVEQGEMIPTAPDGFSYTLFQLNPWTRHNKVLSRIMGRVIVPSTDELAKMTMNEGFGDELSGHSHVSCGLPHKHKH